MTASTTTATSYRNCAAVRAAIGRPLRFGEPGYSRDLDADGDGIACELNPTSTNGTTGSSAAATTGSAYGAATSTQDPAAAAALPGTGFDPVPGLGAGTALVLLGGSLVIVGRRRRPAPTHRD